MEVLNKLLSKLGVKKKPKTFMLNITSVQTKSCGNCAHHRFSSGKVMYLCMHYPESHITDVVKKVCTTEERKLWSQKEYGVISRFFRWLF